MNAVRAVFAKVAGLFVEDRLFALAIAVWIALVGGLAAAHAIAPSAGGVVLFGGLALVLVASVVAGARRER
jgi:hypothetical protein